MSWWHEFKKRHDMLYPGYFIRRWNDLKWGVSIWWHWFWPGWPTQRRCPQCAGTGIYMSEMEARYYRTEDAKDFPCGMCRATGRVHRSYFWRSR